MDEKSQKFQLTRGNALFGSLLVILGVVFLLAEMFDISTGQFVWPFFIIVPGIMLFLGALAVEEEVGQALAIVSGIVTMVGLILLVQSVTDSWASWSYAWALVAPTAAGAGQWLYGVFRARPDLVKTGKELVKVGLGIFVVAAVFFELIIGVNGYSLGNYALPLLLIALGLFLLVRNVRASSRKG